LFETLKAIETQINNRNTKTNIDLTKAACQQAGYYCNRTHNHATTTAV
jgi:hypothetical protein